mmetsp:Transcript_6283/g.19833  ORF Transcript_6283/g.19833 Transcript_6283/m.19833 type:complete len:217 (+) Transcript_6283:1241-1891(+)
MYSPGATSSTDPLQSSGRWCLSRRSPVSGSSWQKYELGTSFTKPQTLQRHCRPLFTQDTKGLTYARHFLQRTMPVDPKLTTSSGASWPSSNAMGWQTMPNGSLEAAAAWAVDGSVLTVQRMNRASHCAASSITTGSGAGAPGAAPVYADSSVSAGLQKEDVAGQAKLVVVRKLALLLVLQRPARRPHALLERGARERRAEAHEPRGAARRRRQETP